MAESPTGMLPYKKTMTQDSPIGRPRYEDMPPIPIDTSPMEPGGFDFRTTTVDFRAPQRVVVRPSLRYRLRIVYLTIVALGLAALAIVFARMDNLVTVALVTIMVLFILLFAFYMFSLQRTVVFDCARQVFFKDAKRRSKHRRVREIPFDQVLGLQMLQEVSNEHYSYELNLVLSEPAGQRVHVMDTGDLTRFISDVEKLAMLLDKPIWNQGVIIL